MSSAIDPAPSPPAPGGEGVGGRGVRRRVLLLVAGVVAVAFAIWYFAIRASNDAERFQGDWQIAIANRPTPNVVRVNGDRWQYQAGATEGKAYRFTLNEAANPKEIDLEPLDLPKLTGPVPKLRGIYEFDGGSTVRVRVGDATQPRPTTFDDPDAIIWVLTRVELQPAGPER